MSHQRGGVGWNSQPERRTRGPLLTGCAAAVIVSVLSCCLLTGLAVSPALTTSVQPPPVTDPTEPDLTVVVEEAFLHRTLTEALPEPVSRGASVEVRQDNRLVMALEVDLLFRQLELVITMHLSARDGDLNVRMESVEAAGYDLLDLLGVDREALGRLMDQAIQRQVEAGLGEEARILGVTTGDHQLVITARMAP